MQTGTAQSDAKTSADVPGRLRRTAILAKRLLPTMHLEWSI